MEPKERHWTGEKVLRELVKIHCVNNNKKKTISVGLQTISYSDFPSSSPPTLFAVALTSKKYKGANYCYIVETDLRDQRFNWLSNFHPCTGLLLLRSYLYLENPQRHERHSTTALRRIFNNRRWCIKYITHEKKRSQSKTISTIFKFKRATVIKNDVYYIVTLRTIQKIMKTSVFSKKKISPC